MTTRHEIEVTREPLERLHIARLCSDHSITGSGVTAAHAIRSLIRNATMRGMPERPDQYQARMEWR